MATRNHHGVRSVASFDKMKTHAGSFSSLRSTWNNFITVIKLGWIEMFDLVLLFQLRLIVISHTTLTVTFCRVKYSERLLWSWYVQMWRGHFEGSFVQCPVENKFSVLSHAGSIYRSGANSYNEKCVCSSPAILSVTNPESKQRMNFLRSYCLHCNWWKAFVKSSEGGSGE